MRLKVLGSDSSGNCYLLQGKKETLILECGLHYKTILKGLNFNISNVVGCLVTHEHKDHSKAVCDIISKGNIDVYASYGTLSNAMNIKNYHQKVVKSEKQFDVGGFTVLPFEVEHDVAEPLGYLVMHKEMGRLLFITDTYYCKYKFKNLKHIMIECNYSEGIINENFEDGNINLNLRKRLIKSHFSLENVKEFLKANDLNQVKDITLLHLSDANSDGKQFKEDIEKLTGKPVYIAAEGLEIELEGSIN